MRADHDIRPGTPSRDQVLEFVGTILSIGIHDDDGIDIRQSRRMDQADRQSALVPQVGHQLNDFDNFHTFQPANGAIDASSVGRAVIDHDDMKLQPIKSRRSVNFPNKPV